MRIGFISKFIAFHNCYKYVISPPSRLAGRNPQPSRWWMTKWPGQAGKMRLTSGRLFLGDREELCCVVYPPVDGITTSSFAPRPTVNTASQHCTDGDRIVPFYAAFVRLLHGPALSRHCRNKCPLATVVVVSAQEWVSKSHPF